MKEQIEALIKKYEAFYETAYQLTNFVDMSTFECVLTDLRNLLNQ